MNAGLKNLSSLRGLSYPVGEIPIVMAFKHGYFESQPDYLRVLLENPTIDVNKGSPYNDVPVLQQLSAHNHWDQLPENKWKASVLMLDMLLTDRRTNVHLFINNKTTALHNVCFWYRCVNDSQCRWEMLIRMFLNAGANPLLKNAKRETSIDIVTKNNGDYVVDLLKAAVTRNYGPAVYADLVTSQDRKNAEDARARLRSGTVRAWAGVARVPKLLRFDVTGTDVLVGDERGLVRSTWTGLISRSHRTTCRCGVAHVVERSRRSPLLRLHKQ